MRPLPAVRRSECVVVIVVTLAFVLMLVLWAVAEPLLRPLGETATVDAALRAAAGVHWTASATPSAAVAQAAASVGITPSWQRPDVADLLAAAPGVSATAPVSASTTPVVPAVLGAVLRVLHAQGARWDHAVLALRLVSVALTGAVPLVVWSTVRRLTRSPGTAMVAAIVPFAVPQLAQAGSTATPLAFLVLPGALLAWGAVRLATGVPGRLSLVVVGLSAAVLPWLDLIGLAAVPAAVAVLATAPRTALPERPGGRRSPAALPRLVVAAVVLVSGALAVPAAVSALRDGTTAAWAGVDVDDVWSAATQSFWGPSGTGGSSIEPFVIDVLTVTALAVIVLAALRRVLPWRRLVAVAAHPVATLLLGSACALVETTRPASATGTSLVSASTVLAALVGLIGLQALSWRPLVTSPTVRRRLAWTAAVVAPLIGLSGLWLVVRDAFVSPAFIDAAGTARILATSPAGARGLAVVGVVTVVALGAAVVATLRTVPLRPEASR